jgi:Rrf2 family protein
MFSKSCEYGIKAVLYIAFMSQKGERVRLKQIAREIDSPEAFTAKIMQNLSRSEIVKSIKGPTGGFEIDEEKRKNFNLKDIVEVIDGNSLYVKCGLGLSECNDEQPCPIHNNYKLIRNGLIEMHCNSTIEKLAKKLNRDATLR